MANIIPMSGLGSRFTTEGYTLPKPLIPVSGVPMILAVIDSLPPAEKWIFMVRTEHIDEYGIDALIRSKIPNAIIISVSETTDGQATTCMLAAPHLDPEEEILIAACDNSFLYDAEKYSALKNNPSADAIIWTFTKNDLLPAKPEAWGWVKLAPNGLTVEDMSVKIPVSENPYNDHAVVGAFYFKKAKQFIEAYELMRKENYRVNNEFYVDSLPIFYKKMGLTSVIFDMDLYIGWGKPADLHQYEEKEYRYLQGRLRESKNSEDALWLKFFNARTQRHA